jgi:hypothetical protein
MKSKGDILASILNNFENCYFFLHNTKELSVVENIMQDGFIFENQLPHSTDRVSPDDHVEITYFLFQRKDYGHYTVIIAIPKITYENYSSISGKNDISIEEILTITEPFYSDNDELIYTVSPKHILGYFNNQTTDFYQNSNWDPLFNNLLTKSQRKKFTKPDRII